MHCESPAAESPRMIVGLGAAQYGPFGPPFKDPRLQASYEAEWRKLSGSSVLITDGTARDLVATVINAALAAGESSIPAIETKVKAAVLETLPEVLTKVKTGAGTAAGTAVKNIIFGAVSMIGLLGVTFWGFSRIGRR